MTAQPLPAQSGSAPGAGGPPPGLAEPVAREAALRESALRASEQLLTEHVDRLQAALPALRASARALTRWGAELAVRLTSGGRLLAAGNGGSAAEVQHLTAELVGRFEGERIPLPALALHGDTSALTAIGNDYGYTEVYARQVRAHARPGDVVLLLSTSGRSRNLLAAAMAGRECGALTWALTGPGPNPLARRCADAVCVPGDTATVQETHLAAIHMLCRALEAALPSGASGGAPLAAS